MPVSTQNELTTIASCALRVAGGLVVTNSCCLGNAMPYVFWEDDGSRRGMELVANRSSITRIRGALGIGAGVFAGAARSFRPLSYR
jgi:hypothetical protein